MEKIIPYFPTNGIIYFIFILFLLFLIISFLCLLRCFFINLIFFLREKELNKAEYQILSVMNGEDELCLLDDIKPNSNIRDYLIRLTTTVEGEEKKRVTKIYNFFGFTIDDIHDLFSKNKKKKFQALSRCRSIGVVLADEEWRKLLKSGNNFFQWTAMEYLISIKKSDAIFWFASFINDSKKYHNGTLQHLLCCLARYSPDLILVILTHTKSQRIIEQCLLTLASYPVISHTAENIIINQMHKWTPDNVYISAVKALSCSANPRTLDIFSLVISHSHWVVRLVVANALFQISDPKAYKILGELVLDVNYYVRVSAMKSLLQGGSVNHPLVKAIKSDVGHPSHEILSSLTLT